jgi:hypothetical protein
MRRLLAYLASIGFVVFTLAVYLHPEAAYAFTTTITTTQTITGWNVPSATTFNHGIIFLMMPLLTMGLFAGFPMLFDQKGDIIVTTALVGFTIGAVAGMLSLSSVAATDIPFAIVIISAFLLVVWVWKQ